MTTTTSSDLVILVPVLHRPHRVGPLLLSVKETVPDARCLFLADPGDGDEIRALRDHGADYLTIGGTYAQKINRGIRETAEPLIFLGADDIRFHRGWFEAATALLGRKTRVVGTNDLCNPRVIAGNHSTHSLLTRAYAKLGTIDNPDIVLHEGYSHNYVDDEFIGTAKRRGAFGFAPDAIVEHFHPMNSTAQEDATYRRGRKFFHRDRRIFRSRRRLWR